MDQLKLNNFDPSGVNGSLVVQTLAFADGSTVNLADLFPPNQAPTVANPLTNQTVLEDAPLSSTVPANTFADPDAGDTLTYSATQADGSALPTWLSFNANTRTFTGVPDDAQVGTLSLAVKATDSGGLTAISTFALTVQNVNEAPTVAVPLTDQTVQEDAPLGITVPANTFVDPDASDTLTYSATLANGSALPSWLSFNATTRTFTGTPDDAQVGTMNLAVKATDSGGLSATSTFVLTVQNVNEAPTVAAPIADQQATQGTGFSLVVPTTTFADVDPGDTLTLSATLANGSALPSWLSFNAATRTFTGTPQAGDIGTINVRVTATDSGSLSVTDVFALTIAASGGTAGNDTLIGTSGNDLLDGLAGDDVLQGLAGNDTLIGGAENDLLDGGTGADAMTGGTGNDTYVVDNAGDTVTENANEGTDTVQSSLTYTLGANVENLTLTGTSAINGTGNALNNILTSNSGANVLTGGAGNDIYYIGAGDTVVEQASQGTDTVVTDQNYTLGANVENLTLTGTANLNGTGNTLNNVLIGNSGNNILDGRTGADTLIGGLGNDTYVIDNTGDVVTENAKEGTDTVQSSLTYTLGANVENLTLSGTAAINGTGNALDNLLAGNSGNNTLSGGAGNDRLDGGAGSDTMIGGTGNDTYVVSQAGDVVTENANEGTDTVESSIAYTLGANLENLTLTGTANLAATGNTLNNIMTGNSGANAMDGGTGNDTLDGGAGNDTLQGGSGDDTVLGGVGDDILSAGSGNDVLDGGDGTDTLDGGSENDILRGGAGNDTISGGSGADQLTGGTGNDTLAGGTGNDLYNFARGDGQDTISDADATAGNQDKLLFGTMINPLDLVLSRQANDLRIAIHGTTDSVTVKNWYTSPTTNQIEDLQAGNGQHLLNTQVNQLIQAMASFSQQSGLTWDQAIDQQPQQVQTILAASWH
jgi:Ca2+-binding RTX toxin-like protein